MFNFFSVKKSYEDLEGVDFKARYTGNKNGVLIDVRTPGEFRSGTIKGARNIDFMSPAFKEQFKYLDKNKEYFLFCRSGNRSGRACEILSKEGFKVYNLEDGIGAWPG